MRKVCVCVCVVCYRMHTDSQLKIELKIESDEF